MIKISVCLIFLVVLVCTPAEAARKKRKRYYPPVTHPVVLWSRTLSNSTDLEERKVAAFKLSQYSQTIYQEEVISTLIKGMRDPEAHIKVLCAKAMGRAGTQGKAPEIRKAMLEVYKADASIRNTLVRAFIVRKDTAKPVYDTLLDTLKQSNDVDELSVLLAYFEDYLLPNDVDALVALYHRTTNEKVKRSTIKVVSERGQGQENVIALLTECVGSKETPLVLLCLSGMKLQAQKDPRTLAAIEKTISSTDPDVLVATLDVLHVLPDSPSPTLSARLIEILSSSDDDEVVEKSILALGVAGDQSEPVVNALVKVFDKEKEEGAKITTALVLGKQAVNHQEKAREKLQNCLKSEQSQSLKTACQLGIQELNTKKPLSIQTMQQKKRQMNSEEIKPEEKIEATSSN